ncbi:tetratricopeptide repeat protein [Armatimonas sp.]|uniref:tetratricopeptide repeat protein n=1 Tax=Armatimonas sp. TaxID=1872638 RepID=UPI00286B66A9|nr:tetratricopeptide repeat protein [Armatimonas sp.]
MNCPGCKARNPIGNKFCRECGQKIPLEENILVQEEAQKAEAERARERAAQLLTRAFTLSQHGKPAEALPLAEEAAELLPESTSALTLCSTLYERLGQNDKAITMMERVVASNPDSAVDADKLARLKRGVHVLPNRPTLAEVPDEESPRRWVPVVAAVVAGGVVLSLGIFAVLKLAAKKDKPLPLAITEVDKTKGPNFFGGQVATPGGMMGGPLSAPQMQARSDPFAPVGSRPMGATPEPRRSFRERPERSERPLSSGSPVLPNPRDAQANSGSGNVPPVTFSSSSGPVGNQLPPLGGAQRSPDSIPAAPPAQNPSANTNNSSPTGDPPPAADSSGFIRVREHNSGTGSGSNSNGELRSSSLGGDPLLRAQTLQASGRYREAITAFREALAAGAIAGDVQQGIALCHQRLGEKAPARSAYQQAIVAFEAQVRGGRSVEQAQRGISVCRAALDVLGS